MTLTEVEDRIVVLLADELGEALVDVRAGLIARGPDWAADSLDLVEVLLRLEEEWEFDAPQDLETQRNLRSVKLLAIYIMGLLNAKVASARQTA